MARAAHSLKAGRDASVLLHAAALPADARAAAVDGVVTECTASELRELLREGRVSSREVVAAFIRRNAQVGLTLGALAEECFAEALAAADAFDAAQAAARVGAAAAAAGITSAGPSAATQHAAAGGALAGVPLSVKEEYQQQGKRSTCGLARKAASPPCAEDGLLVALLKAAEGIPVVRSNLPQLVMSSETNNAVWGRCCNPWDVGRMPGGSSGGEGALIASRCSALGVGSDIAGSVRIPAMACGIAGFRPTPQRVSCVGFESVSAEEGGCEGQNLVLGAPGPMARCVDDLALVMQAWLPAQPVGAGATAGTVTAAARGAGGAGSAAAAAAADAATPALGLWDGDPTCPRMPFDMQVYRGAAKPAWLPLGSGYSEGRAAEAAAAAATAGVEQRAAAPGPAAAAASASSPAPPSGTDRAVPLRFGFYLTDGFFEPAVPCKRAVLEAADALRAAGHEVVEWDPRAHGVDLRAAGLAYGALVGADAMEKMRRVLGGEPQSDLYDRFALLGAIPDALGFRAGVAAALQWLGAGRWADIVRATGRRSMLDAWEWNRKRNFAKLQLVQGLMRDRIDVLLSPGLGVPAWLHGQVAELEWSTTYAWVWNYLQCPAGVLPVTRVQPQECDYYNGGTDLPRYQRDGIARAAAAAMAGAAGLPVGVHVSGLPLTEEVVLRGMRELEAALAAQRLQRRRARIARGITKGAQVEQEEEEWDPIRGCPEAVLQRTLRERERDGHGPQAALAALDAEAAARAAPSGGAAVVQGAAVGSTMPQSGSASAPAGASQLGAQRSGWARWWGSAQSLTRAIF
jgi:Asp-tRNA(Asn)/Glu-tRNA(Gln) amidotransferase A subunit family amidase